MGEWCNEEGGVHTPDRCVIVLSYTGPTDCIINIKFISLPLTISKCLKLHIQPELKIKEGVTSTVFCEVHNIEILSSIE